MKAFRTFIAIAIVGIMALSMATSAFAAVGVTEVAGDSTVTAEGATDVEGTRTVLVATKSSWAEGALVDNPSIVYINEVGNDDLAGELAAMAGKNLTEGDYVVLVGNENGTAPDAANFTAIKVVANAVDGVNLSWEVTVNNTLFDDNLIAKFYDITDPEYEDEGTTLTWGADVEGEITGAGDFTFTAEAEVSEVDYADDIELEISNGSVSGRN